MKLRTIWATALILLLIAVLPMTVRGRWLGDEWPTWGQFGGSRHGHNPYSGVPDTNNTLWIHPIGTRISDSGPAIAHGRVFVGAWDNKLYCLDGLTGAHIWNRTIETTPSMVNPPGTPSFYSLATYTYLWVTTTFGRLVMLRLDGGHIWNQTFYGLMSRSCMVTGPPAMGDFPRVWFKAENITYCLKAYTAEILWDTENADGFQGNPTGGGFLFMGAEDGNVYCLNGFTGAVIWTYPCLNARWTVDPVYIYKPGDERVYVGAQTWSPKDNNLYCLNATNGSKIWNYSMVGHPGSPAVAYDKVYVGSMTWDYSSMGGDHSVHCVNATTGEGIWSKTLGGPIRGHPAIADGKVVVGCLDNKTYCLNATTGDLIWWYKTGGAVGTPAIAHGRVYVGSEDGNVYCFAPPLLLGDTNADRIVDIQDVVIGAQAFGARDRDDPITPWFEPERWLQIVDWHPDGIIDIFDLVTIGVNFGKTI